VLLVAAVPATAADDPYASLLAPAGTCQAADQPGLDLAAAQTAMLCLTNYARAQRGLAPLKRNTTLDAAGQAKVAANLSCGEFTHTPCGKPFDTVFDRYLQGASSYRIGENIAWGTGSYGTPRGAMNGWLHSAGHRENILNASFAELGIGYLNAQSFQGYTGATLWSQEFGTRTVKQAATTRPSPKRPPSPTSRRRHASARHRAPSR
jgi:uncharacterized protein YkwD